MKDKYMRGWLAVLETAISVLLEQIDTEEAP